MQLLFGIGALWGNRSDVPGVGPDQFGILQDNSIDFSFELKELYSQLQFPVDIARGKGKISGKAKMARVFGALYADLFFGSTTSVGETNVGENESHVLATNTVSVTNATGFLADLGVYYTDAGNTRLTFTTGAPSAGQYATGTNGTYTFNTGDIGKTVAISYCFTDANGLSITITNQFMGYTPTWTGTFYTSRNTQGSSGQLTLRLNECVSSKLNFPSKIDDYNIPEFDYLEVCRIANGNIKNFKRIMWHLNGPLRA